MSVCQLCEGWGIVCKDFGIDSEDRPDVVPCPRCTAEGALTDLAQRVREANEKLVAMAEHSAPYSEGRKRLESKAEGVRLVLSYIEEAQRISVHHINQGVSS